MMVCNCFHSRYLAHPYRPAPPVTDERFRWLETFITPGQLVDVYEFPSRDGFGGTFDADHLNDLAEQGAGVGPDRKLVFPLNPTTTAECGGNRNVLAPTDDDDGPRVLARRWLPVRLYGGDAAADELGRVEPRTLTFSPISFALSPYCRASNRLDRSPIPEGKVSGTAGCRSSSSPTRPTASRPSRRPANFRGIWPNADGRSR